MMRYRVSLVVFLVLILNPFAPVPASALRENPQAGLAVDPEFKFSHISTEQGLSNLDVWSVARDNRGFMWFGTQDGLNRFDGYQMRVFKHDRGDPRSLSENTIRTLYVDRQGTLWIGTWTGGLERYDPATESFTHFRHNPDDPRSLSSDSVFAILQDNAGNLWLGTRGGGLDRFDPQTQTFVHYRHDPNSAQSLSNDNVFVLLQDHDGALWAGTDGGLNRFDPDTDTFTAYKNNPADPASLSNNQVHALSLDDNGILWVGTAGGGLERLDLNQVQAAARPSAVFSHYQSDPKDSQTLSNNIVPFIHRDTRGRLWVGTYSGGLNRLDEQTGVFQHYLPQNESAQGINARRIYAAFEDARTLWFGTSTGVYFLDLDPKPFHTLVNNGNDPDNLAANEIDAIYQDPQGSLWVSTTGTGLNRVDRNTNRITHYRHDSNNPDGLGLDDIWGIAPSRDGELWLATFGAGLDKFDPRTGIFTHYRHDPANAASLASNLATSVLEDSTGAVWVGTWDAGLDRFDPATKTFTHFPHIPTDPGSLSDNAVLSLHVDRRGALWTGTLEGALNRIDPDTRMITHDLLDPQDPGSSSISVAAIYHDRSGALWIATYGDGLYQLNSDGQVIRRYSHEDGLPSDAVFSILEDEHGLLWLGTNNGLSRFDPTAGTFRNFDASDGLPGNTFQEGVAFASPDGEMFFGSADGLVYFYPDQIHDNLTAPPVVLTNFLLSNKPVPIGGDSVLSSSIVENPQLTLSYQDRVVSFEFAALNYVAPQKNRYRYKLEGFDTDWTEVASDRRVATYTNLDPGEYTFRVLGSNNDGIWNQQGVALRLTVTPPWWETTWFRLTMIFLAAGLVAGGFVWQRRRAVVQQRRLEAMVVERTRELQDARHQISTLFDSSPAGIIVARPEGEIIGVNQAMQRMTGYSEDELMHSNVRSLYANSAQREIVLAQLNTAGSVTDFGIQLRRRDGSLYYASLNLSKLEMAGQEVLLGITEDVTDQVEAHTALTTLHEISQDLASIPELQTLLDRSLQQLHTIVDFQQAVLMLMEHEMSFTIYHYFSPTLPPTLSVQQIPLSRLPSLRTALDRRETIYVQDAQASATMRAELESVRVEHRATALEASRSWLILPLLSGERAIGLLHLLHDQANHYAPVDIELARTFANHLAVAIDNIHLNEQARRMAAAEERSRIARELHDSVTQTLFTASVLAEATPRIWNKDQDVAGRNLERLSLLLRGALAEMRSLLLELRTGATPDQTLNQLLNTLAEAGRARGNLTVDIDIEAEGEPPAEIIMTLYRVAQEALNNVIKHAEATRVVITARSKPDRAELHVRDDGRGFDPLSVPKEHMGIGIMRERVKKIGGDLQIQSQLGHGTEVIVVWPTLAGEPKA